VFRRSGGELLGPAIDNGGRRTVSGTFRRRPEVVVMRTSCGQGDGSPLGFYERYGFEQTGEIVFDNEILLQLKLR
jgi:hypothetical protein